MKEKNRKTVIGYVNGDIFVGQSAHIITENGLLVTSPVERFLVGPLGSTIVTRNTVYTVFRKRA